MTKHVNPGLECLTRTQLKVAMDAAIRAKALVCPAGRASMSTKPNGTVCSGQQKSSITLGQIAKPKKGGIR